MQPPLPMDSRPPNQNITPPGRPSDYIFHTCHHSHSLELSTTSRESAPLLSILRVRSDT